MKILKKIKKNELVLEKAIKFYESPYAYETVNFTLRFRVRCLFCKKKFHSPSAINTQFCSEECKEKFTDLCIKSEKKRLEGETTVGTKNFMDIKPTIEIDSIERIRDEKIQEFRMSLYQNILCLCGNIISTEPEDMSFSFICDKCKTKEVKKNENHK